MSANTGIAWTNATWNPVRGCSLVSAGCTNCYAMRQAHRFSGAGGAQHAPYEGLTKMTSRGPVWTGNARVVPELLDWPLRLRAPKRIFVNSMSDLFHENVPDSFICAVFAVMETAQRHTFQILTKRPDRMRRLLSVGNFYAGYMRKAGYDIVGPRRYRPLNPGWPLPNVHIGVSVEDQTTANERIPHLLSTPAVVRFISYEPALGPVDFTEIAVPDDAAGKYADHGYTFDALRRNDDLTMFNAPAHLNWIIVGGESGPRARPFDVAWARSVIRQCRDAEVPCFIKQIGSAVRAPRTDAIPLAMKGSWTADGPGAPYGNAKPFNRAGSDMMEWPPDLRVQQFPQTGTEPAHV